MNKKNKSQRKTKVFSILLSVILMCSYSVFYVSADTTSSASVVQSATTTLSVTIPPENESLFTPGRDFYVVGQIHGEPLPNDAKLTVALYPDGSSTPVRNVYANKKEFKDGLYIDYPLLLFTGEDRSVLLDSMMPDLVYDGENLDTFADVWRKCYYDDENFTAIFCGGNYSTDLNLVDESGEPLEPLEAGDYNISVTAEDNEGNLIAAVNYPITMGVVPNKVLSRFSPQEHLDNVWRIAEENGYRIYWAPFPGIWFPDEFIPSLADRPEIYCQILPRWRLAEIMEYMEGMVHFYIYNVTDSSVSYTIEMATLQYTQSVYDPERIEYNYYDIGEIFLPNEGYYGKLIPFSADDYLQLTRVDFPGEVSQDGNLVMSDLNTMKSDLDLSDGVNASVGDIISIYGVFAPVQNDPSDITWHEDNSFTVNNHIKTIRYTWSLGSADSAYEKPIGVNRVYDDGSSSNSILEFKNDFEIMDYMAGQEMTVSLIAVDSYGNEIPGTEETFVIYVD